MPEDRLGAFLDPYGRFLLGAAYNVQQTLEGLGLNTSNFVERGHDGAIVGSAWSASAAVVLPLGLLVLLSAGIGLGLLLAGYVVARRKGLAVAALVLGAPGLAALAGILPPLDFGPDEYVVGGTGVLGEGPGMIPLVVLALGLGWSMSILGMDLFGLGERYRNVFDHVWYAIAVIAGVFFVGDTAAGRLDGDLKAVSETRKAAAGVLARQARDYSADCRAGTGAASLSCAWASAVQERLAEYALWPSAVYRQIGPATTADLYRIGWEELPPEAIVALRREIRTVNDGKCPVSDLGGGVRRLPPPSDSCQAPPAGLCPVWPDPLDGMDLDGSPAARVAVASECIVPALVSFRAREADLTARLAAAANGKHQRWLFYICLSILAGAKVAGATAKTFDFDKRPAPERRRLSRAARGGVGGAWRLVRRLPAGLRAAGRPVAAWVRRRHGR